MPFKYCFHIKSSICNRYLWCTDKGTDKICGFEAPTLVGVGVL